MSPRRRDHPPGPTATDQLAAALRRRVLSGALDPGEAQREEELSERTGHSRHTVRAALARLADERVVELVVPMLTSGERLSAMSAAARRTGHADADETLARMVLDVVEGAEGAEGAADDDEGAGTMGGVGRHEGNEW